MPAVARGFTADTVTTECGTTTTASGSLDVFVLGVGVHRKDDANTSHTYNAPNCDDYHTTHILVGSTTVFANTFGVARLGDYYNDDDNDDDYVSTVNQSSVYADGE